jgi:XisI protein
MDNAQRYGEILTTVLRRVAVDQPSLQRLRIRAVCDRDSGQFLIIGTGWEQQRWLDVIFFHAWLKDGRVVVEENTFESIVGELIESGVSAEDIVSSEELEEEGMDVVLEAA